MRLINSPTRITLTSGSTIDHIWSDDVSQVNEFFLGILTSKITDHFTVLTKLNITYNRRERVLKTFRDHSERALSNFSIELQNFLPHFQEQNYHDFHHKVELLCSNLYNIYDSNCPIRKKNISINRISKPWITNNLLSMVNTKHEMRDLANRGVISKDYNNVFKNRTTVALKNASCSGNIKKTRKCINSLIKIRKPQNSIVLKENN